MDTFEQIWDTSRSNSLSWMYPAAIWCGLAVLIALNVLRNRLLRRIAKLVAIGVFSMLATEFSAQAIHEKWRIRREWADLHPDQMTEAGLDALYADGANLTLGPVIFGFRAFVLFVGITVLLSLLRALITSRRTGAMAVTECDHSQMESSASTDSPSNPPDVVS
ncbi:MAG: hypothetical protein KDB27_20525 [Planctomycetales bacterium]|nr:hypothetical protein [Planctomycetales bacterium]